MRLKNNFKKAAQMDSKQHFGIRKLTVGAVSVLIGTSFWLGNNADTAHAADESLNKDQAEIGQASESKVTNASSANKVVVEVSNDKDDTEASKQVVANDQQKDEIKTVDQNTADKTSSTSLDNSNKQASSSVEKNNFQEKQDSAAQKQIANNVAATTNKQNNNANTARPSYQHNIDVTMWDDVNDRPITFYNAYDQYRGYKNGHFNKVQNTGETAPDFNGVFPGYQLLDPEEPAKHFDNKDGRLVIPDHDVDFTLHYAPLANVQVNYIDQDSKKLIMSATMPSAWATPNSKDFNDGDEKAIQASPFEAFSLTIPGYELISNAKVTGKVGQLQEKDNPNPIMVDFYYRKTDETSAEGVTGKDKDPQVIGANWSDMPGGFSMSGVYGSKNSTDNGDLEKKVHDVVNRYENQGYSYLGTIGDYANDHYYNYRIAGIWLHLIPNKDITVNFVDQDGKALADSEIIATNKNNPDQTNKGINNSKYWFSAGTWSASPKDIADYHLIKTEGATTGIFAPFDQHVTFVYKNNQENLAVKYIDVDSQNKTLATDSVVGKLGSEISYSTQDRITNFERQGYKLVSDGFDQTGKQFNDENDGKTYIVKLAHDTVTINPEKPGKPGEPINPNDPEGPKWGKDTDAKSLTNVGIQTVHYEGAGENTPKDNVTKVEFGHSLTLDRVTGEVITDNGWTPTSQAYKIIDTPTIKGYTPDKYYAGGETVQIDPKTGKGDLNRNYTITYTKNPEAKKQSAQVKYIDLDNDDALITESNILTGKPGDTIQYSTQATITDLIKKGYELANDGFPEDAAFDNIDDNVQVFRVTFHHAHTTITPEKPGKPGEPINPSDPEGPKWPENTDAKSLTKEGTQVVHYEGAGENTPKDNVTTIEFAHSFTIDNVTGKIITDNGWIPAKQTYEKIVTPIIDGYTSNVQFVGGDTITVTDQNINRNYTVTYTKNPEKPVVVSGHITYYDDTTKSILSTADFSGKVGDKISYTTSDKISQYEKQGFELVSNNFKDNQEVFGQKNNEFEVHLKHGTKEVTPQNPDPEHGFNKDDLIKTGKQKVIYTGAGKATPENNVTTVEFAHTLVIDVITGKIVSDQGWMPVSQTYQTVKTPEINGYTADKLVVGGETVTANGDLNKTYVVTYTKNPEAPVVVNGQISYIDDTIGKTIATDKISGEIGEKISYVTAEKIHDLENKGYELVSNNFRDGKESFAKEDNNFEVHVKHGIQPVTPDNPGKPGETINPHDPNGPKYPENSDQVTKDVIRTIHYEGAGEDTPKDIIQKAHFTGEGSLDKVTGEWVKEITWTGDGQLSGKTTPTIAGYHVVKVSRDQDGNNVSSVKVMPNTDNYTVTVTYEKDQDKPVTPSNNTPEPQEPTSPQEITPNTVQPKPEAQPTQPTEENDNQPSEPEVPSQPETVRPLSQNDNKEKSSDKKVETVAPHAQKQNEHNDGTSAVKPIVSETRKHVTNGVRTQSIKQLANQNSESLPLTGSDENSETLAAIAGGVAVSMSLIGLLGIKKREN